LFFFSIDNALYSIAFGTHTKTVEPIEVPYEMMSGLGPWKNVLCGGDDPRRGMGNFGDSALFFQNLMQIFNFFHNLLSLLK